MDSEKTIVKYRSYYSVSKQFYYFCNGKYYESEDLSHCISERICSEFAWSNAEQWTTMKDKNKKDIYANDYIYNSFTEQMPLNNGLVSFSHDSWGFDTHCSSHLPLYGMAKDSEVIGNIHEGSIFSKQDQILKSKLRKEIGKKIKHLRFSKGITHKHFIERSGISASFLSEIERGVSSISAEKLYNIAKVLKTPIQYFFAKDE